MTFSPLLNINLFILSNGGQLIVEDTKVVQTNFLKGSSVS